MQRREFRDARSHPCADVRRQPAVRDRRRPATAAPPPRPTPSARRARRATWSTFGSCNDCHTPLEDGTERARARHDARADRPPERLRGAAAAGAASGPWVWPRRGHQHRVRRPVGHQLHRQPDARQGDRPRQLDRGDVHRGDAHRTPRGQGPADPAADAVPDRRRRSNDEDLKAVFAYLQSLPPVNNRCRRRSIRRRSSDNDAQR